MSLISDRLRIAREKRNLKQTQVMDKVRINNKTLSGYENGVSEPDIDTLRKLAALYNVSVDWLTGATNDSAPIADPIIPPEQVKFLNCVKNNVESTFFYDFDNSPEDSKKFMMETLRMVWEREKGRILGHKQEE